jgi:hypothetical protein
MNKRGRVKKGKALQKEPEKKKEVRNHSQCGLRAHNTLDK